MDQLITANLRGLRNIPQRFSSEICFSDCLRNIPQRHDSDEFVLFIQNHHAPHANACQDPARQNANGHISEIQQDDLPVKVLVVRTNEEREIALQTISTMASPMIGTISRNRPTPEAWMASSSLSPLSRRAASRTPTKKAAKRA